MSEIKDINFYLKEMEQHGLKATLPRVQVLKILLEAETELSVIEIECKALKSGGYLSPSTVYNTLMALKRSKIVNCLKTDHKKSLYSIKV